MLNKINEQELRLRNGKEGLILCGCGGDPNEWVDGINDMLTADGILKNGTRFTDTEYFKHGNLTCILFNFTPDADIDMGQLSVWRLRTKSTFGGTWLSDFVENELGGYADNTEKIKPDCPLIGADGNIFNLLGIASRTLKENGMKDEAAEMYRRIQDCGSYYEALAVISDYVNITGQDDEDEPFEDEEDEEEDGDEHDISM